MARKRLPLPVSKVSAPASRAAPRAARTRNEERYALAMQSINTACMTPISKAARCIFPPRYAPCSA